MCEFNIKNLNIKSQGTVIKFITKGMLEEISIPIFKNSTQVNLKLKSIYHLISKYKEKNKQLKNIKQLLLNKYF